LNERILLPRTVNFNKIEFARNTINDGFVLIRIAVVLGVFVVVNVAAEEVVALLKSVFHGCWFESLLAANDHALDHAWEQWARSSF
jgi:hypothetical protein